MLRFLTLENGIKKLRNILASFISYDNTTSGLTATDVQTAIDEISQNVGGSTDINLDGGFPDSVYTSEQCFDGGVI